MNAAILGDIARARGRSVLLLLGGLLLLSLGYLALYPSMEAQLAAFVGDLPEAFAALIGDADMSTPAGYVRAEVFALTAPLLISGLAIAAGASLARSERDRTLMGIFLSPAPRGQILRTYATAVLVVATAGGAVVLLAILVGGPLAGASLSPSSVVAATVHLVALAAAAGTVALAGGAATGSPAVANGMGWGLIVVSFLMNSAAELVEGLAWLARLSPWSWYGGGSPLQEGLGAYGLSLLVLVVVVATILAHATFTRRDLQI